MVLRPLLHERLCCTSGSAALSEHTVQPFTLKSALRHISAPKSPHSSTLHDQGETGIYILDSSTQQYTEHTTSDIPSHYRGEVSCYFNCIAVFRTGVYRLCNFKHIYHICRVQGYRYSCVL